jgi:hypothetical protein
VNEVLAPAWSEQVVRLQLGVEPVDALGSPGSPLGIAVHSEDVPRPYPLPAGWTAERDASAGLPALRRGPSGRFALPFRVRAPVSGGRTPPTQVLLRLVDPRRGFVPRRLSVPVPTLSQVLAAEAARDRDPSVPLVARACRPVVFPGAAYGVPAGATLLRGRVTRKADGAPVPWARVEATVGVPPLKAWWAHGDEQGEFVLVVGTLPDTLARLSSRTVDLALTVHSRPFPPDGTPVDSPTGTRADPLWHLPVETLGSLDPGDPVARGVAVPSGYASSPIQTVTCRRGGTTGLVPVVIT